MASFNPRLGIVAESLTCTSGVYVEGPAETSGITIANGSLYVGGEAVLANLTCGGFYFSNIGGTFTIGQGNPSQFNENVSIGSLSYPTAGLTVYGPIVGTSSNYAYAHFQDNAQQDFLTGVTTNVLFQSQTHSDNNPPVSYSAGLFTFTKGCTVTVSYSLDCTSLSAGASISSFLGISGDNAVCGSGPWTGTGAGAAHMSGSMTFRFNANNTLLVRVKSFTGTVSILSTLNARVSFLFHQID